MQRDSDSGKMISITSNELNYLIFRYLTESGFTHSAFTLGFEAGINKNPIDGNLVPPAALITFIQKGIQYLELEANLNTDDLDSDEDFQFLNPLDLITKDVNELQRIVKERKESLQKDKSKGKEKRHTENGRKHDVGGPSTEKKEHTREKENEKRQREKEKYRDRDKIEKEKDHDRELIEKAKGKEIEKPLEDINDANPIVDVANGTLAEHEADGGAEPMDICSSLPSLPCEIPDTDVKVLHGHTSEVFACAWDPTGSLLATGSGDATARIWTIDKPSSSSLQNENSSVVLRHFKGRPNEKAKDVTTLDWNVEGTLLATGSYDGQARIWSRDGELKNTLSKHKGPIFSLKWNKQGSYLVSGSVDKTAIVWDAKTGECKQQFAFHTDPALDVDWRNNSSFATCSADSMIYVCKVGDTVPLKCFKGHKGEVNAIKWDPTGTHLASCSDDCTAKLWSLRQDTCTLDMEHNKEIYTVRWSPTGPGTNNPNKQLVLASASFDSTIKIWDVDQGFLKSSLHGHSEPVYSVAFSPDGDYLASGSLDKSVHIWSVKESKIVKTFCGKGGIFEVCWNKEGDRIAACFANNVICVLDLRM